MKYNEWKLFTESLRSSMTLGLSHPKTIGGPIGSNLSEFAFDDDDEDEDNDDEDEDEDEDNDDGQQTDDDLEGDLVGSSPEDEGPDKNWPPDGAEDGDEFGGESDDLASAMGGDEFGDEGSEFGDEFGGEDDDLASALSGGMGDAPKAPETGEPNMDFLDDLPMDLLGGEEGEEGGLGAHDELGEPHEPGTEEPCPECNPDGMEEEGDPDCPTCQGLGFVDDVGGPDGDELGDLDMGGEEEGDLAGIGADHNEMPSFMNMMNNYMKRYMRREWDELHENVPMQQQGGVVPPTPDMMQQPQGMMAKQNPLQLPVPPTPQQQMMRKKMVSFMRKDGTKRSFMAADAPRKRKNKKHCPCESTNDFLNSLCKNAGRKQRGTSGISEEALFALADPNAEYAQGTQQAGISPGTIGFAPQSRVGSIGGGYTKDDINDIPVLGESRQYPTLTQFAAMKARKRSQKRR